MSIEIKKKFTVLITGGTGSLGQAMARFLLEHTDATIRIYSRDEYKQSEMCKQFGEERMRYFLGDVRDLSRLHVACIGVDLAIHAAALKKIEAGEYNIEEFVKTNVYGTQNVIAACRTMGIKQAIFVSTDKAVHAINGYGFSKGIAERLWVRANTYTPTETCYAAVRYGNVHCSRGSVVPFWQQQRITGQSLTLTSPLMTRFWMSIEEAVRLVWFAANYAPRGSILVPHLPAYYVVDLLQAVWGDGMPDFVIGGLRPGEKLAEQLLNDAESATTLLYGAAPGHLDYYCIPPVDPSWPMAPWQDWPTPQRGQWEPFPVEEVYTSDRWPWRLSVDELRERLKE